MRPEAVTNQHLWFLISSLLSLGIKYTLESPKKDRWDYLGDYGDDDSDREMLQENYNTIFERNIENNWNQEITPPLTFPRYITYIKFATLAPRTAQYYGSKSYGNQLSMRLFNGITSDLWWK